MRKRAPIGLSKRGLSQRMLAGAQRLGVSMVYAGVYAGACSGVALGAAPSGSPPPMAPPAIYDSGWSLAPGPRIALAKGSIAADVVLPPDALDQLELPASPVPVETGLQWRPAKSATPQPEPADGPSLGHAGPALSGPAAVAPGVAPQAAAPQATDSPQAADAPQGTGPEAKTEPKPAPATRVPAVVAAPSSERDLMKAFSRPIASAPQGSAERKPMEGPSAKDILRGMGTTPEAAKPAAPAASQPTGQPSPLKIDTDAAPLAKPAEAPRTAPKQSAPVQQRTPATQTSPPQAAPAAPLKPLSRSQMYLRSRLRSVLAYYYNKPLNSRDHDPWQVMHGMLAYELHSKILDGGPTGSPITSIGYLCYNKPCKGKTMLSVNADGELDVRVGVGLQGHKGQFLAMLAQSNVSPEYPIRVDGQEFTIADLIRSEQRSCFSRTELSFKLMALMHYLPSDATWVNENGEQWDIPKLIADERTQKIRGAACGGTHRLMGLGLAVRKRALRGEPMDGEWGQAAKFVESYQNYCFRLQNSDGSMSTEWFRGPGEEDDIDRRIRTTGHQVELLAATLPDEKLEYYRTVRAVTYLTNLLATNTKHEWEEGTLCHALHALVVYDRRVFGPHDKQPVIAGRPAQQPQQQRTGQSQPSVRSR
ncbi:hypothetical protein Pla175_52010 [Pirellulimonas nuda]|uniref:Uncharacterized protein n=1 Tax=Pirellulimonas nuda TaxID=2528009 RepID=A0A518DJW9_9BACT|nr:hypothetical protein [Pirellulimonas nuda]QDU91770.1 hypothetical protein Pla175_52010 [Pirellulimonas nuda]